MIKDPSMSTSLAHPLPSGYSTSLPIVVSFFLYSDSSNLSFSTKSITRSAHFSASEFIKLLSIFSSYKDPALGTLGLFQK